MKPTKIEYQNYLNGLSPEQGSEHWIIGGTIRMFFMWKNEYGSALRKHDPVAFEVGFREYKRSKI